MKILFERNRNPGLTDTVSENLQKLNPFLTNTTLLRLFEEAAQTDKLMNDIFTLLLRRFSILSSAITIIIITALTLPPPPPPPNTTTTTTTKLCFIFSLTNSYSAKTTRNNKRV